MATRRQPQKPLTAAMLALMVIPPIAFVVSIPWLKGQSAALVFLAGGIASTLTVVSSFALSILHDRGLDEWHRSAKRFSSQWGWTLGSCVVALLMALPPVHDLIVSCVNLALHAPKPNREQTLLAFTLGFVTVVLAQCLCTVALSVGWTWWMSRASHEAG